MILFPSTELNKELCNFSLQCILTTPFFKGNLLLIEFLNMRLLSLWWRIHDCRRSRLMTYISVYHKMLSFRGMEPKC